MQRSTIKVNDTKAQEIAKSHIRKWREEEFKINDIAIQDALINGTSIEAARARQTQLREMPDQCDGKSATQLKALLASLSII